VRGRCRAARRGSGRWLKRKKKLAPRLPDPDGGFRPPAPTQTGTEAGGLGRGGHTRRGPLGSVAPRPRRRRVRGGAGRRCGRVGPVPRRGGGGRRRGVSSVRAGARACDVATGARTGGGGEVAVARGKSRTPHRRHDERVTVRGAGRELRGACSSGARNGRGGRGRPVERGRLVPVSSVCLSGRLPTFRRRRVGIAGTRLIRRQT